MVDLTTFGAPTFPSPAPKPSPLIEGLSAFGSTPAPSVGPTIGNAKKAQVAATAEAKKFAMADAAELRTLAAAQVNGNQAADDPVLQDLRTLPYGEIVLKYGEDVAKNSWKILQAETEFRTDLAEDQTDVEVVQDTGVGLAQGAFNLVGSIAALGTGVVSDRGGAAVSGFVDQGSEWFDEKKSNRFQTYSEAQGLMGSLDQADNRAEYEEALADPEASPGWETMKFWGKSALDAASRVATDPVLMTDFLAQNVGTLIPSTALAKGAQAVATGTKAAKVAVPAAVALGESGAAYTGAVNRVMDMTPEQLMESSPDYRALVESGLSPEEAQLEVATNAGQLAAAVQAPLAAVAGKFVQKFEVSPMAFGSLKGASGEIVKQVGEEAFQEGTGQFNQNLGIQTFADENQELSEGVPEGIALGAIGGAGVTAIAKAPGLAKDATIGAVKGTVGAVTGAVESRLTSVEAARDAASPVGATATTQAAEAVQASMTAVKEKLAATDTKSEPTSAPQADLQTRMTRALDLGQAEINAMPPTVQKMFLGEGESLAEGVVLPRVTVADAVMKGLTSGSIDPQSRKDAILWLHEQAGLYEAIKDADISSLSPELQGEVTQIRDQLNTIQSNATFKRAVDLAPTMELKDLGVLPEITDETVDTPEVRTAVGRVVQLAHTNPTSIDPAYAKVILNQVTSGKIGMEEKARARLQAAVEIAEIFQQNETDKTGLVEGIAPEEGGPSIATVRNMILSDGRKNELGQYGLKRHLGQILSAARAGNTGQTQLLMTNLRNFAEHMQNRVSALNESLRINDPKKNKVSYRTWDGNAWIEPGAEGSGTVYAFASSPKSIATGQAIVADAETVADIYDTLARGLGSTVEAAVVDRVDASPEIVGKVKERRIRKDAVVKTEESLVEQEPKTNTPAPEPTKAVTPKRPKQIREEQAKAPESEEFIGPDGETYVSTPMPKPQIAGLGSVVRNLLEPNFEGGDVLVDLVQNWRVLVGTGPFGGFAEFVARTLHLRSDVVQKVLGATDDRIQKHALLHEIAHLTDAALFEAATGDVGQLSHSGVWTDPELPVGQEIKQILDDRKHFLNSFLRRYATTYDDAMQQSEEIFAELLALFLKNPAKIQEVAPNVSQLFTERLSQAFGVTLRTQADITVETEAGQLGNVSPADGRGATPVNGPASEEAAEETKAAPEEKEGEDRSDDAGVAEEDNPEIEEASGKDGTEGSGADAAVDASAEPGRLGNPFTNLVKSAKGLVRFVRAYTIDDTKSPLVTSGSPIESVLDSLKNFEANRADLFIDYELDEDQKEALASLVQTEVKGLVDAMNAKLLVPQRTLKGADKELISPLEALAYGEKDFTGIKESRSLNLVDENTGEYDAVLIELAAVAALNWAMNSNPAKIPDAEDVAKMFGVSESQVTGEMMQASRNAVSGSLAVESLAREIMEFWGAKINGDAPMSDSLGIAQGLASDLLSVMRGKITEESLIEIERDGKTLEAVAIKTSHPATEERIKKVSYARSYLKDAFVKQSEKAFYFDEPPAQVRSKQKRNLIGKIGSKIQRAMRKHQEQKFYRNTPMLTLMTSLGQDAWMDMMGFEKVIPDLMNREHRLSVEGRNTQLQKSWEGVQMHNLRQEAHARATGKTADEVVTHFDVYAVSNERIHQDGFNPQSNKTMRETWVSTESKLDLDNTEHRHLFWLTVGQSSGLVKTEIVFDANEDPTYKHAKTAVMTEAKVEATYGKAIGALMGYVRSGEFTTEDQATFKAAVGKGVNEKLIHSLLAVAQYRVAMEKPETRKEFRHFLSLEADGKTDGPMAALVNHSMGKFTVAEIRNFRRGGFFLGQKGRTLNDQFQNNTADTDLYDQAAKGAKVSLKAKIEEMTEKGGKAHAEAMMRILSHFSGDFSYNEQTGELVIKRGLLKNPLTVTVYGSGANGIADKISGAILEAFYERMTELEMLRAERGNANLGFDALPGMEGYATVLADLQILASSRILFTKKDGGKYYSVDETEKKAKAPLKLRRPRDFVLSPANREMFSHNLRQILVNPMREGIGQVMANPQAVNAVLQKATQVQSQTMMAHFRQAVKETMAAKRASGDLERGEFLSQNDYNEIYRKMSRFGAVIEPSDSNENHLNLSGSESVKSSYEFTRSLEGSYGGGTRLPEPTDAGVSVSAMMTISRGDAMMMVNYFASQDPDLRTLAVFDGLEMPADGINEISEKINKAVAEAWLNDNGPKDLADSFADFIRQGKEGPFAGIQDVAALQEIAKAMGLEGVAPGDLVSVMTKGVASLSEELNQISTEIQARKAVMRSIEYSMDHMASGRTPHNNEGEAFDAEPTDPNYDDKLVGWLNLRYAEELAKLKVKAEDQAAQTSVAEPTAAFTKKIKELGVEMGYRPITRMTTRAVAKLLGSDAVSKDAKDVLAVIQKSLQDFTFFFGSSEELTDYRDETYPELVGSVPVEMGQTDMHNKVVYIANGAAETVLHEALHTATLGVVLQGFTDPSKLDEVQKAALENLERMMTQFMDMDFRSTLKADLEQEDGSVINVAQVLQRQVADLLARGDELGRAIALNEFMAWTLSNQNLIDVMRKTKVRTPLRELVFKATAWVRKLLGLAPTQKLDMFSNILANTGAVLRGESRINATLSMAAPAGVLMNQTAGQPVDNRLQGMMEKFETKIAHHLRTMAPLAKPDEELKIKEVAHHALDHFKFHGFDMDAQQSSAFSAIQQALASSMQMDNRALVQAQRIFSHVTKQLSPKDFEGYADGNIRSQSRFDMLMGAYGWETDLEGRSNVLGSFLALSQVDPEFRRILQGIDLPKDRQVSYASTDEFLTTLANSTLDTLASAISGSGFKSRTSREALDRLSLVLSEIEKDDRLWIEKQAQGLLDTADSRPAKFLSDTGERLSQWADAQAVASLGTARNRVKETIRNGASVVGALLNENRGKAMASAAISLGNQTKKVPTFILELMDEVIGITDENIGVKGLVNKVKAAVSGMRQDYREEVPTILAEKFSRELTDEEWSAMHLVLGKTDSGVLRDNYAGADLRKLLTDKAHLAAEIQRREEELKATSKAWATYQRKAKELARFMVTGEVVNNNLLRNAGAIAALMGEVAKGTDDAGTIELIDILTTLYALNEVDQAHMDMVSNLADTEADGIDFLAGYLWSVAKDEKAKVTGEAAWFNHYKGYIPSDRREGISLVVRDDSEHNTLKAQGYTRMGDYKGAGVETGKMGYYFSTVSGNGTYTQGAMQTIQQSASGVDPRTGRTITGTTAGVIHGKYLSLIKQRLQNAQRGPVEALLPIYDAKGVVVAYERHMAPHALAALERNTHMGEMLGSWAGRQAEEELGQEFNHKLVDNLKAIWEKAKTEGRTGEFVDLSDETQKDQVYLDSWKMVPNDLRTYIEQAFGDDGFMIRKDMINNAVGYRAASITDPWTGISRVGDKQQEGFVKMATVLLGQDAFTKLATAEKAIQAGVSVVKSTIVIRSIVIPMANLASNFMQLSLHGVSVRDMYRGYQTKLVEIVKYQKNLKRAIDIKAEMTSQRGNHDAVRRLETELKSLEDSNRRMSIWPLIDAGEFATISEGLTDADAALASGKWAQYIQGLMDRVPAKLGTVGRYAFITRDTALFQGMARAMQYGDALSKGVLYDHLVKQGKTQDQALRGITEEFVSYNLLPGRTRTYADSMGLTWFWAFKLRSIKVALGHIRNHPFRALMLSIGNPLIPDVPGMTLGSPIEDNMLSVIADGRLGYSVGPGMAFNAPSLHPWVNLVN